MNNANDDSALAAMAGDMPDTEMVDILNRKITTLGQQVMANKERAIIMVADEVFGAGQWNRTKIAGAIYPGGREVYRYAGQEFIELAPVKFNSVLDGNSFKIEAVQSWRKLEPQQ